ncbi:MAG: dihydroorotase [Gammaproteobacteria bacterium]|nr:MAG: dihydroorotase [Gammaproteobacteria bacterium]
MKQISIIKPDDMHLHLRNSPHMEAVVNYSARQFARAIIMPNTTPPVFTAKDALAYRNAIENACEYDFKPLMTIYLTEQTDMEDVICAVNQGLVFAVKLYPAGATTNSSAGVGDIRNCSAIFEILQEHAIPLSIHCESVAEGVDIFDREKLYIDNELTYLVKNFPELKIVCEHATTKDMVQFVREAADNIVSTITPHHLFITRHDIFAAGINPHNFCLPIAKTGADKDALIKAATSGNKKFFAGTDSAPHPRQNKEKEGGSAGIFSAANAIELYTQAFDKAYSLDKLQQFTSINGTEFYGLTTNSDTITLIKEENQIPEQLPFADSILVPFLAGQKLEWRLQK